MIERRPLIGYNFTDGNDLKVRQKTDISSIFPPLQTERRHNFMKHFVSLMVSLVFVFGMLVVNASADVNVNIGISVPPLVFAAPPDLVVVPSGPADVYLVAETPGVYFYGGYWYRFYGGRWFRATIYSGPWAYVTTSLVPVVVVDVPPDYVRHLPRGYYRIHYQDFDRHWRGWDRTRHWNKYDWYKKEVREYQRRHPKGYKSHGGTYRPPKGGEHGHAAEGRGSQPMTPYKALEEKGHKPKGEGHKPKGEYEQKGEHHGER